MQDFIENILMPILVLIATSSVFLLLFTQIRRYRHGIGEAGNNQISRKFGSENSIVFSFTLSEERMSMLVEYLERVNFLSLSEDRPQSLLRTEESIQLIPSGSKQQRSLFLSSVFMSDADFLWGIGLNADLRGVDLNGAKLIGAKLRAADFSGANLSEVDFSEAYLANANLRNANLFKSKLVRAKLHKAILSSANLKEANLSYSNLQAADLTGANLMRANLRGADLREALLSRADLSDADISGADLSTANIVGTNMENVIYDEETKWPADYAYLHK